MKIAMVSEHASPLMAPDAAGVDQQRVHVAELAAALCGNGHEVMVYTRRDTPGLPDRVRTDRGYEVVHLAAGPAERLESFSHLGDFTSALASDWYVHTPDVVHAHAWTSGLASVLASRRTHVPVVQTYHGLGIARSPGDSHASERIDVERLLTREVTHVVASSSNEAFDLMRMGMNRSRIAVIPSGVDTDTFTPDGPRASSSHPHRILTVADLAPHDGLRDLIDALSTLESAELVIAGTTREAKQLREFAERSHVAERVVVTGEVARSAQPALLRSADLVVCAPWCEAPATLALEAMACGVPVVATAVGGIGDLVVDGVTGLHVPPRGSAALVRALHGLLVDDTARYEFGIAGRDRACARYSWERIASDTLRVYQLSRRASGSRASTDRPSKV
ncbi:glycosyltransferase family 1 protein [Lentzea sp. PSKA42]|uniref:Glycosyltransferase family 1 protein n=1 Tax=Lentzea indica TaxID=2604800 RepID=A0ABX1FNY7_9PSEU|nr:glycosyltransferase [Lentzea indica]NKE60371.1 glycosyltransferase family 1 protein [Lentzea indica]